MNFLSARSKVQYDTFLTYAENIGQADCLFHVVGVDWITTRMPIVPSLARSFRLPRRQPLGPPS